MKKIVMQMIAIAFTGASDANAVTHAEEMVFIYSDICQHGETGDLLGDRVIIIRSEEQDYVVLQTAEGVAMPPSLGEANIDGGKFKFFVTSYSEPPITFVGEISPTNITGTFSNGRTDRLGHQKFNLTRQPNKMVVPPRC